jgi:hypothetical protein
MANSVNPSVVKSHCSHGIWKSLPTDLRHRMLVECRAFDMNYYGVAISFDHVDFVLFDAEIRTLRDNYHLQIILS